MNIIQFNSLIIVTEVVYGWICPIITWLDEIIASVPFNYAFDCNLGPVSLVQNPVHKYHARTLVFTG